MNNAVLVKRYAEGYLRFAKSTLGFQPAVEEFRTLKTLFRENRELESFLVNKDISQLEKNEYIKTVLSRWLSVPMQHFLSLLLDKGRISFISEIADYVRLTYVKGEAIEALIKTTFPLDTDLLQSIKNKLEKHWGKQFKLSIHMEPQLLGGVQIVIGNYILDGSVRNRLEELRRTLKATRIE